MYIVNVEFFLFVVCWKYGYLFSVYIEVMNYFERLFVGYMCFMVIGLNYLVFLFLDV